MRMNIISNSLKLGLMLIIIICINQVSCSKAEKTISSPVAKQDQSRYHQPQVLAEKAPSSTSADARNLSKNDKKSLNRRLLPRTTQVNFQEHGTKLIKNAHISLEIKKYNKWYNNLENIIKSKKGSYISNSNQNRYRNSISGKIVIRVPKDDFQDLMNVVKKLGKLISESIDVQDVTSQYIDLEAKLKNKLITEKRFKEIIQGKAQNVTDLLQVERQLESLSTDIDRLKGQINYLENKTSFSTIHLTFRETGDNITKISTFWRDIGSGFEDSFKTGIKGFFTVIYVIIVLMIGGIPIFLVAFFGYKFIKKYRAKSKAAKI